MIAALSRKELIELVLVATTDELLDERTLEVLRPNILVAGCRHPVACKPLGYSDPEGAAHVFAARVADAFLDRLSLRSEVAAKPEPRLQVAAL